MKTMSMINRVEIAVCLDESVEWGLYADDELEEFRRGMMCEFYEIFPHTNIEYISLMGYSIAFMVALSHGERLGAMVDVCDDIVKNLLMEVSDVE